MKRLAALALGLALMIPAVSHAQIQPVPKWHSDPLYWATFRGLTATPPYTQSILHGMGVETDTLEVFSLTDAVPPPYWMQESFTQAPVSTGALNTAMRDSTPVFAKVKFEVDTSGVAGGWLGGVGFKADSLVFTLFQALWAPPIGGSVITPVTPAVWIGKQVFRATIGGFATDSSTALVEVPIPQNAFMGPSTTSGTVITVTTASNWTVAQPVTVPYMGGKFFATVKIVGGTFPACRSSLGYYRLE